MDIQESKLNFTLASRWLFPSDQGGVAMHNGYLLQALKDKIKVKVLTLENTTNRTFYEKQGIPFEGLQVPLPPIIQRQARTPFLKNGLRSWQDWRISLAMAKALEVTPPEVVEFMDIHSEGYAYLKRNPKRKRKPKVVIRSHTPWGVLRPTYFPEEIKGVDGWWAIQREYFCFHACDAITTPSEDLKQQLIRTYKLPTDKITVIPNILDTDHFKPMPAKRKNSDFTFLHIGRFERAKGVVTMTEAFIEAANNSYRNIRLINVGQPRGSALNQCIQLLEETDLASQVHFTGFVPYEELPKYYSQADTVIVPPEIYESFSYTVAQALSCAKQVIASDSGGMPQTIAYGKYGRLFAGGDVDALAKAILHTIEHRTTKYDGENLRQYALNTFSMTILGPEYQAFYQKIAGY